MGTGILCLLMGAAMVAQQPADNPADPVDPEIQYWKKIEAVEKAKKAAFDARKAALDAKAAEFQAGLGSVTGQTAITGSVTEGTDPGRPEALVLAVDAANRAADRIADDLTAPLRGTKQLLLVTSADDVSLAQLDFYDFQRKQIDRRMIDAKERLDKLPEPAGEAAVAGLVPPLAAAGALLDAASKLGSYFLTDYKFGKVDITLPDRTVMYAAAAYLRPKLAPGGRIYIPQQLTAAEAQELVDELDDPSKHYLALVAKADEKRKSAGQDPAVAEAVAAADAAAKSWEAFVTTLTTAPAQGETVIDRILRQKAIKRLLGSGTPILVLNHQLAGSYYTKKNLWTFLGGPPLYTAAAVAVSYALLDGADRQILASGTVPLHSGYGSVTSVMKWFRAYDVSQPRSSNAPTNSSSPATPSSSSSSAR